MLKFLIAHTDEPTEDDHKVQASSSKHKINRQYGKSAVKSLTCFLCGRDGHKKINCPKFVSDKKCNFCKLRGHNEEECYKKKRSQNTTKRTINKIDNSASDLGNLESHKTAKVDGHSVSAYIDFGSGCNTMKKDIQGKLGLKLEMDDGNVVIEGYGGSQVVPLGIVKAEFEVDEIETRTEFYVVPNTLQSTDVLIGRPITERENVFVYKTPQMLKLTKTNLFVELPDDIASNDKISIYAKKNIVVRPGVNLIGIKAMLNEGVLYSNLSEKYREGATMIVPENKIRLRDGTGYLRVLNLGLSGINIQGDACLARGVTNAERRPELENNDEGDHMNKLRALLERYSNCFKENTTLLSNIDVEMTIELSSKAAITCKPYRLSLFEREKVRKIVADLMEKGIVEPANSPYASPILLLKKKTGDFRMVVDYRRLNSITVKDKDPLPLIEDQLERVAGNGVFTTLDLRSGYHQINMERESRKYTAFVTPDGHYQYTRVPFGLSNAPAVFQRAINTVLGPIRHDYALVYLDDILVLSKDFNQGLKRLEIVLNRLSEAGLTLNKDKCEFLKTSVEYLGAEISNNTIRPSPRKVEAVVRFAVPTNVHQTRQFLGLASYFRKFIRNFVLKAKPLTLLLKKKTDWVWSTEQQDAFNLLREELSTSPVLATFNTEADTQLHTDASQSGIGGVLLQKQSGNEWKPVAYMSRQTIDAETRYHSYELETLAVYEAVTKFRNYLYGKHFIIKTDCNAMRLTWSKKEMSPRVGRWWLAMQDYDFTVEHCPGTQMKHADALSRNAIKINTIQVNDWVVAVQTQDEDLQLIREQVNNKEAEACYTIVDDKVCRKVGDQFKIIVPKDVRWRVVRMFHDDNGHPHWERTFHAMKETYWFKDMRKFVKKFVGSCLPCMTSKRVTGKRRTQLHPIEKVAEPFHTLHLDHLGPFCKTPEGNTHILATIDGFTKFVWLEAVPDTSSLYVCKALEQVIKLVHPPKRVITDRGKGFDNRTFL